MPLSHAGDCCCHFKRQNRQRIECRGGVVVGVRGVKVKLVNGKIQFAFKEQKNGFAQTSKNCLLESTFCLLEC